MKIEWIKIKNYKSYKETEKIYFSESFNVIVGQNNVGKTALIEALGQNFIGNPHKSINLPANRLNPLSEIVISISMNNNELKDLLLERGKANILVNENEEDPTNIHSRLGQVLNIAKIEFHYKLIAQQGLKPNIQEARFPPHGIYQVQPTATAATSNIDHYRFAEFRASEDRNELIYGGCMTGTIKNSFDMEIYSTLVNRVYVFKAERLNIGTCQAGTNLILNSDASNLPEVLHNLLTKIPRKFDQLTDFISTIFPSIFHITVTPQPNNQLEIKTWTAKLANDREDLMIPLADSGTGVGQALAILFVALTSNYSTVIIIDEPNSFLHPSASRKLIQILKQFPLHQFIVSTHSPEVIRAAGAETIDLIRWDSSHSIIEQLQADQLQNIKECLLEVGAKLSDVFGADHILWVEGITEEEAFNLFLNKGLIKTKKSVNIIAVRNTGDFDKKNKHINLIMDIYTKLSNGNALIPPALGFIFDKEKLTAKEIEDISRQSHGLISFLPRRMYECYILSPQAITSVMNTLPSFTENNVSADTVEAWIRDNSSNYSSIAFSSFNQEWLADVDAANLLKDLFSALSNNKESYDKKLHSIAITEEIINTEPTMLEELTTLLNSKLNS